MHKLFITGANSGLGLALTSQAKSLGYSVDAHNGRQDGDIMDNLVREKIIKCIQDKDIDVFINNAGQYFKKPLFDVSDRDINSMLRTNLVAPIYLSRDVLKLFAKRGQGNLYNINSLAGIKSTAEESIYCASKFGLKGFTDAVAAEFKDNKNIRIVNVTLGAFQSKMVKNRVDYNDLPTANEVARCILDHIQSNYDKIKQDLIITRK